MRRMMILCLTLVFVLLSVHTQASAATSAVVATRDTYRGVTYYRVIVLEEDSATAAEVEIRGLPIVGTILSIHAVLESGSGTEIHSRIGRIAGFVADSRNQVAEAESTAVRITEQGRTYFYTTTGKLFLRNEVDSATTDNVIYTEILILEGVL